MIDTRIALVLVADDCVHVLNPDIDRVGMTAVRTGAT
jgi:hypothetical protein